MPRVKAPEAETATASDTPRTSRVAPVAPQYSNEVHTADFAEPAIADKVFPEQGLPERGDTQIAIAPGAVDKAYLEELAFNEQPVTIRIEPSQEEHAPLTVDLWVNGKGAEVLMNGKWMEFNFLPVGIPVITKRKYVEVLARTKSMKVATPNHADGSNIDKNTVSRTNVRKNVFSVLKDSPRGHEWLNAVMAESF